MAGSQPQGFIYLFIYYMAFQFHAHHKKCFVLNVPPAKERHLGGLAPKRHPTQRKIQLE